MGAGEGSAGAAADGMSEAVHADNGHVAVVAGGIGGKHKKGVAEEVQ